MDETGRHISGEHKTMFAIEVLHAMVVTIVVIAATVVYLTLKKGLPSDLLGFVYGGAITYAGGRASQVRGVLQRKNDRNGDNG